MSFSFPVDWLCIKAMAAVQEGNFGLQNGLIGM